jgi:hypothetical protein
MSVQKVQHKIVGKGYSKREALEDARSQAQALQNELDGQLTANPQRGSETVLTEAIKPSVNVEKYDQPKYVNRFALVVENERQEDTYATKREAESNARQIALETGKAVQVVLEKVLDADASNVVSEVSPAQGQVGEWEFTFNETIVEVDETDADEAEVEITDEAAAEVA